jgi:glutathione S-transferase
MIYLHQPSSPSWDRIHNMSPFCLKLEAWLRLAGIPYESKRPNFRTAPKGKIPYIRDTERNLIQGDSGLIISDLTKAYNIRLDDHLTDEQRAISIVIQRTIEEHLYFGLLLRRWGDDESFAYVKKFFSKILPPVIGGIILRNVRKKMLESVRSQGMGRHSRQEVEALCMADLDAIAILVGDKPFVHGEQPTSIDATLYGFLPNILWTPWACNLKTYALGKKNLVAHCERMHKVFEAKSTKS